MASVFRHLHTINSAAKLSVVKLELETLTLIPFISAIALDILIKISMAMKDKQTNK
jgi:hypothetical protein